MSWTTLPMPTKVNITPCGSTYDITLDTPTEQHVPPEINKFLKEAGWEQFNFHTETREPIFEKTMKEPTGYEQQHYCRWYEAMAYEFYRFLTIGDK